MGTPCTVAILKKNGSVEQVYINYDGYYSYGGAMLLIHYRDANKVKDLISFGNISSLGRKVHPTTKNHTFDNRENDVTTYYGRDRGETGQEPNKFNSYQDFLKYGSFDEYNYLFDEKKGNWFFVNPYNRVVINKETMETAPEKPRELKTLVKKVFEELNSELKIEFQLYEKELQAEKDYKKLKKELPQKEKVSKKIKV